MDCLFRDHEVVKPVEYLPKLKAKVTDLDSRIALLGNTEHDEHIRKGMQHKIDEINAAIVEMEKLDPNTEVPKPNLHRHHSSEIRVTPRTLGAMGIQYMA
eukprot:c12713_g1_i2.p2 GENE.c12713_g1_i2~~c12713_g1_i2.p2  ORF type:complete len:100 (+),score=29.68 c12713_g1_i2:113-412(+)